MPIDAEWEQGFLRGKQIASEIARFDLTNGLPKKTASEFYRLLKSGSHAHNVHEGAYRNGYHAGFSYEVYEEVFDFHI